MNYQPQNSHNSPLAVLKFKDKINLENILFISKSINNLSPSLFNNWFVFSSDTHKYNTSWSSSSDDKLEKYSYRTTILVLWQKFDHSAIESWNNDQNNLKTL